MAERGRGSAGPEATRIFVYCSTGDAPRVAEGVIAVLHQSDMERQMTCVFAAFQALRSIQKTRGDKPKT